MRRSSFSLISSAFHHPHFVDSVFVDSGDKLERYEAGDFAPWTLLGEHTSRIYTSTFAIRAGVYESWKASGPRKPGKSQRKSLLFPWDYSKAFPGCKASGLAASPLGQKHHGSKPAFRVSPRNSGNQVDLCRKVLSAIAGPGRSPPWRGV